MMKGKVHEFLAAATAGRVSIDAESAERMARKVDAIADRARDRLDRLQQLDVRVPLGTSPVAKMMAEHDRRAAVDDETYSARTALQDYIIALTDLATAIRTSARTTSRIDEDSASTLNQLER